MMITLSIMTVLMAIMSCTSKSPIAPEPGQKWELKAILYGHITDAEIEDLLVSYSEVDLKVVAHLKPDNFVRFSFDGELIDEMVMIDMLERDYRVLMVGVNKPALVWLSGIVAGVVYDNNYTTEEMDHLINEIILSYPKWNLRSEPSILPMWLHFAFSYNHNLIDDFEIVEILRKDERIHLVGLPYSWEN